MTKLQYRYMPSMFSQIFLVLIGLGLSFFFLWRGYVNDEPQVIKGFHLDANEANIFFYSAGIFMLLILLLATSSLYDRLKNGVRYIHVKDDRFIFPAGLFSKKEREVFFSQMKDVAMRSNSSGKYAIVRLPEKNLTLQKSCFDSKAEYIEFTDFLKSKLRSPLHPS